jgi:hypothetical protein
MRPFAQFFEERRGVIGNGTYVRSKAHEVFSGTILMLSEGLNCGRRLAYRTGEAKACGRWSFRPESHSNHLSYPRPTTGSATLSPRSRRRGSHKPTRDECEAARPNSRQRACLIRRLQPVRREVKSTSSVLLKTALPNHLEQTGLLPQSPLREGFLFLPNSPGRKVPQSPSPSCEKEPDPYLLILATVPGAFGQGI